MSELQHALAVETGDSVLDEDNIPEDGLVLSACNGLVTYEKERGCLDLVHYTFQQYLEQKAESLFPEAQVEITRTCLTYLSFDEFEHGPCHEDIDFRIRLERWPLLSYAVSKWGLHARQGAEETCRDLIFSFISQEAKLSASVQILCARASAGVISMRSFPLEVSPLWFVCFYGLEYTVSRLLASQSRSVGRKTTWGDTALHQTAASGNVGILALLLANGADVTVRDNNGNTSLHYACLLWSNILTSDVLTSLRQQTLGWTDEQKMRALDVLLKVTRLLLDHGADVNAVNVQGETALHLSIMIGQHSLTQLLLARGADVTLKNRYGNAPLTLTSLSGSEETVRILFKHDLQRQVQCGILNDAMRMAAFKGQLFLLKMLLAKSSEQASLDSEGRSLPHFCACEGSLNCLEYLGNSGCDLGALDKQKRTCFHSAAADTRAGSRAVLEYLLGRGYNPSQTDVDGWTPLLWAAKAGSTSNIETLLDADANDSYQDDREWIPFAVAMYHENTQAAAFLRPPNKPLPDMFQTYQSNISLRHPNVLCDGCDLVSHKSLYCSSVERVC